MKIKTSYDIKLPMALKNFIGLDIELLTPNE